MSPEVPGWSGAPLHLGEGEYEAAHAVVHMAIGAAGGSQLGNLAHWLYHALLSLHIIGVVAGYISLVGPVLPAPCFSMRNGN